MVLSNDEATEAIGILRLGFVALLAPLWILGGIVLAWFGEALLGIAAVGIGLIMIVGGHRLYRAIRRPDVVGDERTKQAHHRAGYNAFWTTVLTPGVYVGFSVVVPSAIANRIAQLGGTEFVLSVGLAFGFLVYLGSSAYYRLYGL